MKQLSYQKPPRIWTSTLTPNLKTLYALETLKNGKSTGYDILDAELFNADP